MNQARATGEDAIKGTENHDGIEGDLIAGQDSKHAVVRKAIEGATEIRVEVAYAMDVFAETVRLLGSRLGRNYGPLKDSEIALTVDAVVIRPNDDVWVWDWKSRKRVAPAAKNWQVRAGAVCVMKHLKLSEMGAAIGYLDNDESDSHRFDAFDIPVFFADMRSMLKRIGEARAVVARGETPEVHAGSWCTYCPALAYCPAHTRLARNMLGELSDVEKQIAFMTAEQAGKAWTLLKQIQNLADKVETSLKLRAKQDVVPLPNGKRLALVDSSRANFDKKKALEWIKSHGGNPAEFEGRTYFETIREINMPDMTGTDGE
jgi:hypothetical protein